MRAEHDIMGREIETMVGKIRQVDISHQEMDRILKALEEMYTETKANTPQLEWMPVQGVGNLLCHELGCARCPCSPLAFPQRPAAARLPPSPLQTSTLRRLVVYPCAIPCRSALVGQAVSHNTAW